MSVCLYLSVLVCECMCDGVCGVFVSYGVHCVCVNVLVCVCVSVVVCFVCVSVYLFSGVVC